MSIQGGSRSSSAEWRFVVAEVTARARRLTQDRSLAADLVGEVLLRLVRWRGRVVSKITWSLEVLSHVFAETSDVKGAERRRDATMEVEALPAAPASTETEIFVRETLRKSSNQIRGAFSVSMSRACAIAKSPPRSAARCIRSAPGSPAPSAPRGGSPPENRKTSATQGYKPPSQRLCIGGWGSLAADGEATRHHARRREH